ncbi:hypothetical protein ACFPRL_03325 [Pseudoclavibacter helvolus]
MRHRADPSATLNVTPASTSTPPRLKDASSTRTATMQLSSPPTWRRASLADQHHPMARSLCLGGS